MAVRSNSIEEQGQILASDLRRRMWPEGKVAILIAVSARFAHMCED